MPENDCEVCERLFKCGSVIRGPEYRTLVSRLLCEGVDSLAALATQIVALKAQVDALEAGTFDFTTTEQEYPLWTVDAATLYAKYVAVAALPNTTTEFHNHGITGLDRVIRYWGEFSDGTNRISLPHVATSDTIQAQLFFLATQFKIVTAVNFSTYSGKVFMIYTKS